MLSSDDRTRWDEDGFIVMPGLVHLETCDALLNAADEAVQQLAAQEFGGKPEAGPAERADTVRGGSGLPSELLARYQLSADGMMVFWDPDLADPAAASAQTRTRLYARLGHCIHRASPDFEEFIARGPLAAVAAALHGGPVQPVQSLIMAKQPGSRVRFEYHHDGAYIRSVPDTLVVAWLALDDADEANGCLRLLPGSHLARPSGVPGPPPAPLTAGVAVPMARGTAALWHGDSLHASDLNRSDRPRRGLIAYYVARGADVVVEPCRPR